MDNGTFNFRDFRAAFLHSKAWTHNSLEVPNTKVILNEDFVDINSLVRIPEQIQHFHVYWINKCIAGEVCLPGQWNYAYVDGKFYHLVKMHSNGFIKGSDEEWFFYDLVYDDWQNHWIKNDVYIKGTIELTGDPKLVLENLHQMSPIIENVNDFRFLNGIERGDTEEHKTELKIPDDVPINMEVRGMSSGDRIGINNELEAFYARGELKPVEERLMIPFLYKIGKTGNWKWVILEGLKRHAIAGFKVFDVTVESVADAGQAVKFKNILENLLGSKELYLASSHENRIYSFAKSVNPTKWISHIDLSECKDITVLDRLRLVPLYGVANPAPKFTIQGFVDKICNKHGWPSSMKTKMMEMFEEIIVTALAPLFSYDPDRENKIFKNVGIEKIKRDVVDMDDPRGATKNPEWLTFGESRMSGANHHQNLMWDNASDPRVISSFDSIDAARNPERTRSYFQEGLDGKYDYLDGVIKPLRPLSNHLGNDVRIDSGNVFNSKKYSISQLNALVYLPDEYKLVSEDDPNGFLDFSKNANELYEGFALLPDYDRKTYTLGYKKQWPKDGYTTNLHLITDPKDPSAVDRKIDGKPINLLPIVFDEIELNEPVDAVNDGQRPSSEFLKIYKNYGKNKAHPNNDYGTPNTEYRREATVLRAKGAELLTQGLAFRKLIPSGTATDYFSEDRFSATHGNYAIRHKMGSAKCHGKGHCAFNHGSISNEDVTFYNNAQYSYSVIPLANYSSKNKGRRFQFEMSFPVKTDNFYIIDILRKYDHLPDAFLRGDVINTQISKGYIDKNFRTFWDKNGDGQPGNYTLTKEEQEKIPQYKVVQIGVALNFIESGGNEDDKNLDRVAINDGEAKHPGRSLKDNINKLLSELCDCFFQTKGENEGEKGAIPDWIKNETALNTSRYPTVGGRSQLSISYCKPHKGIGYTAGIRFVAPKITKSFRFTENKYMNFDLQETKNGFMALIPNNYDDSNKFPKFTFREKVTEISMNTQLAFLTNNYKLKEKGYYSNTHPSNAVEELLWGNDSKEAGNPANELHERFETTLYNGDSLLLTNYIQAKNTGYKTKRMDNPKKVPIYGKSTNRAMQTLKKFLPFDEEVPPFVIPYINPDSVECDLHTWERNDKITDEADRFQLYREKLEAMLRSTLQMLSAGNTGVRFDGTNGYASIKLNTKDGIPKGDYELFTNEIANFRHRNEKKGYFINHKESDVDVIINTRNELNAYGNKFPLKSKLYSTEDELDLGLHIKPLDDVKQTQAAAWYRIQMNYNELDVINTFIETPKELTDYSGFSAFEREKLIREIGLRGQEFMYDKQMLEYQKEENKFQNQFEKDGLYKEWKYGVIRGATQIVGGAMDMVTGGVGAAVAGSAINMVAPMADSGVMNRRPNKNYGFDYEMYEYSPWERFKGSFHKPNYEYRNFAKDRGRPPNRRAQFIQTGTQWATDNRRMAHYALSQAGQAMGGAMGIVGGAVAIAEAYETFDIKDELRKQKFAMAEKKLAAEGDIINMRHEFDRKNLLDELWAMSANVVNPQLNSNIVYKLYNKDLGINDVHMVQYFPSGNILKLIKNYYQEFGYNVMVRNFECTGIQDIKTHLRYQFIYEINHPNISVQEMIRARALAGIKVIPWVQ